MALKELFNQTTIVTPNEPAATERVALGSPSVSGGKNITWTYFVQLLKKLLFAEFTIGGATADYPANDVTDGLKAALDAGHYNLKVIADFTVHADLGTHTKDIILDADELRTVNLSVSNTSDLTLITKQILINENGASKFTSASFVFIENTAFVNNYTIYSNNYNIQRSSVSSGVFIIDNSASNTIIEDCTTATPIAYAGVNTRLINNHSLDANPSTNVLQEKLIVETGVAGSTDIIHEFRNQDGLVLGYLQANGQLRLGTSTVANIVGSAGLGELHLYPSAVGKVRLRNLKDSAGATGNIYIESKGAGGGSIFWDNDGNMNFTNKVKGVLDVIQTYLTNLSASDTQPSALIMTPDYEVDNGANVTYDRHNYIIANDPVKTETSGTVTITDSCIVKFDKAVGTHTGLDSATTKTTPSAVDGWMKVNVNGTIMYSPLYLSKTT